MDFHTDNLDTLFRSGLNRETGTLFVAQALSYYLSVTAMERIFKFIIKDMKGRRTLIFDYVDPATMATLGHSDWFTSGGTRPFCLDPESSADYLSDVGFQDVFSVCIQNIEERLTGQSTLPSLGWHIVSCAAS